MFGLDTTFLIFVALATVSAGAVAYGLMFNNISNEAKAAKRLDTVKKAETDRAVVKASRDRLAEAAKRRKSVQDSLKDLDERQKDRDRNIRKPPLRIQLRQAGMSVTIERFYVYSAITGVVVTILAFIAGAPLIALPGALVAGAIGLPRWFVSFRRGRRVKAFLNEFP
ncbi:MAG: pilus assembly protein, partial [Rhizobiaceae bacterium]|nr:pilus assembly protein [Rhizobiaceae bacterium]